MLEPWFNDFGEAVGTYATMMSDSGVLVPARFGWGVDLPPDEAGAADSGDFSIPVTETRTEISGPLLSVDMPALDIGATVQADGALFGSAGSDDLIAFEPAPSIFGVDFGMGEAAETPVGEAAAEAGWPLGPTVPVSDLTGEAVEWAVTSDLTGEVIGWGILSDLVGGASVDGQSALDAGVLAELTSTAAAVPQDYYDWTDLGGSSAADFSL